MISLSLNQLMQLTRALCFFIPINKWVLAVGIILSLIGSIVHWVWAMPLVLMMGLGVAAMFFVLTGFYLPAQLVAVASSRQLGSLANIRLLSCAVVLLNAALASLFIVGVLAFKQPVVVTFSGFIAIFTTIILLQLFAVWASQKGWVQFVLWMLWFMAIQIGEWFIAQPLWFSFAVLTVTWLVFLRWWLYWKPAKYIKNMAGCSQAELNAGQMNPLGAWQVYVATKPKTLVGTLLMGGHDGGISYLKRGLIPPVLIALAYVVTSLLLEPLTVSAIFSAMAGAFFCIFIAAFGSSMAIMVFKNFKKIWLLSLLPRGEMFNFTERLYYPALIIGMFPIVVASALVAVVFAPDYFTIEIILLYLVASLSLSCMSFYLGLVLYKKTQASILYFGWLNGVLYALGFGYMVYLNGFSSLERLDKLLGLIGWTAFVGISLVLGLRWLAERSWRRIDFKGGQ